MCGAGLTIQTINVTTISKVNRKFPYRAIFFPVRMEKVLTDDPRSDHVGNCCKGLFTEFVATNSPNELACYFCFVTQPKLLIKITERERSVKTKNIQQHRAHDITKDHSVKTAADVVYL